MKIFLATDHGAYELKNTIRDFLKEEGYEVTDMGAHEYDAEDDYPDFIIPAAEAISSDSDARGVIFGGSGQGEALAANKVKGIRAAVINTENMELVELTRTHNNANVLSLGGRFISEDFAKEAVKLWLETDFEGGRHERRLKKIEEFENSK